VEEKDRGSSAEAIHPRKTFLHLKQRTKIGKGVQNAGEIPIKNYGGTTVTGTSSGENTVSKINYLN
jgi:hypothetical protein